MTLTSFTKMGGQVSTPANIAVSLFVISVALLVRLTTSWYRSRRHIAALRESGLPVAPEWNWVSGNLMLVGKMLKNMPKKAHKTLMFSDIVRNFFPQKGCCYLDLWPFSYPFLMVMSPSLATQATQTSAPIACERPPRLDDFFKPLAGGPNLFDLPEKDWKSWRAIFNKGFSPDTLTSFVPGMVDETEKYRKTLMRFAQSGELFQLDSVTLRFTIDFIGRTVLNTSLGAQTSYNILADSMLSQASWQMPNREINPLEFLNLPRYVVQWLNGRRMNRYIGAELDKRFEEYQENRVSASSSSVIDLVLQAYMAESEGHRAIGRSSNKKLDPGFRTFATSQIRLFLFVGHDSMSSTICYAVHLLSQNLSSLERIRTEHDEVFGTELSLLPSLLKEQPQLLSSLHYTTAVIKETLRLFPPGSGIRQGYLGADLVGEDGTRYPTGNTLIWILHTAIHRAPQYWAHPDDFLPERWLVGSDHALYPRKGAWRAFEWGPRNCIGQGLAMTELRITLAMIAREFDFRSGYDEWDQLYPRKGVQTYRGERAYQIEEAAAHPADNYPCRMSIAPRH